MSDIVHLGPVAVWTSTAVVPYDLLPRFVWPVLGLLLLVCASAYTYRFVMHQALLARRELDALRRQIRSAEPGMLAPDFGADGHG